LIMKEMQKHAVFIWPVQHVVAFVRLLLECPVSVRPSIAVGRTACRGVTVPVSHIYSRNHFFFCIFVHTFCHHGQSRAHTLAKIWILIT
jgi:hypothetical protein